jgi:putative redox protein
VDALLSALAACTSIDVVEILSKCRTPVGALRVDAVGDRASATPAKVTRILLTFHVDGEGIKRTQVERAVELAVTKYCSVRDTLDPALPIEWAIVVNGA